MIVSPTAAVNSMAKLISVPNILDFKHLWPQTHLVKMKWEKQLKTTPHFSHQAGFYSRDAMAAMCSLMSDNTGELFLDQVIVTTSCWTSLRAVDICNLLSKNVSKIQASESTPVSLALLLRENESAYRPARKILSPVHLSGSLDCCCTSSCLQEGP